MPEPSPYPSNLVISNLKKNVVVKLFSYLSFTTLVNLDLRCEKSRGAEYAAAWQHCCQALFILLGTFYLKIKSGGRL